MRLQGYINRVKRLAGQAVLILKPSRSFDKIIFIAGTGRSGTTWLAELINYRNEFRFFFEPFYNQKVPQFSNFKYRQYLRTDLDDPEIFNAVNEIFTGKNLNYWITSRDTNPLAVKLIIKDIRANLMLGYLKKQYPEIKLVLLVRHPIDVAVSKIKLGWNTHLDVFLKQPGLMEDFLAPFREALTTTGDDFEKHIALWCVENYVPMKYFKPGDLHVVFYEDLVSKNEEELEKLFNFLGEPFDRTVFDRMNKRSTTDWNRDGKDNNDTEKVYDAQHIRKYRKLTGAFGLEGIYNTDEMPDRDFVQRFMEES